MALIKQSTIEQIFTLRIEEAIGKHVELRKQGSNYVGLSPFVDEKTPSFTVSSSKQIWKDFSTGRGGNIIKFYMEKFSLNFYEAVLIIAKDNNIVVEYEENEFSKSRIELNNKKDSIRPLLEFSQNEYYKQFQLLEENHPAKLDVIKKRNYTTEIINEFKIGFVNDGKTAYNTALEFGKKTEAKEIGLISEKGDKFYNRLVYPIHDKYGLIIGFAGRSISNEKRGAKWINPSDSFIYNKDKVWYGLHTAIYAIKKQNEAWIVEGYNDVIAWQTFGFQNTIASCGTSITIKQILELKKYCNKINLCFDADSAGKKAMLKYIPEFIKNGFSIYIQDLGDCDPDEFVRKHIEKYNINTKENPSFLIGALPVESRVNGFRVLLDNLLVGDEIDIAKASEQIISLISEMNDHTTAEIYMKWLAKETKTKITTIERKVKELRPKEKNTKYDSSAEYHLPKEVKKSFSELENDIKKYGMFIDSERIYMIAGIGEDNRYFFSAISNFSIEILQHMVDEKFPMKLFRMKNIYGQEKVFDAPSESVNTMNSFDNMVTGHGNFRFDGDKKHLLKLRQYLFDKMGTGRKIDVLGWQPDANVWVWNNKITDKNGVDVVLDENGVFVHENTYYYVPSANVIYKNNTTKFEAQKKFKKISNESLSFDNYISKVKDVHRDHSISAILFGLSSIFQDIVCDYLHSFPILFFYGPGSTGKDELAYIVQSFVGIPQVAINLEANVSTLKAQIREFAQFRNGISQLSEYKRGNAQLDGVLKSLWDRRGYKRGNIESFVGTESIPIESSAILTGNDFPQDEPLILRLIWNEMTKNQFSEDEMKRFDELKDVTTKGVSGWCDNFIKYRDKYSLEFPKLYGNWKSLIKDTFPNTPARIIQNLSVLTSTYQFFRDNQICIFPFSQQEMMSHFKRGIEQQMAKINSSSIMNRFWDLFVISLRGHRDDRLQLHRVLNVEGNILYFQWTHVYAKIQRQWYVQFHEMAPGKSQMKDSLIKSEAYIEDIKTHSFDSGRDAVRSSATAVNLMQLPETLRSDILSSIEFQMNDGTLFSAEENEFITKRESASSEIQGDLGF